MVFFFFFQAEDGIRDLTVTGVQTCALPILKQDPSTRHIPVQMLTLDEDRQHGLARGAFAFVTKRSEEHTSELQSQSNLVCRLLLEKKKREDYKPVTQNEARRGAHQGVDAAG